MICSNTTILGSNQTEWIITIIHIKVMDDKEWDVCQSHLSWPPDTHVAAVGTVRCGKLCC